MRTRLEIQDDIWAYTAWALVTQSKRNYTAEDRLITSRITTRLARLVLERGSDDPPIQYETEMMEA